MKKNRHVFCDLNIARTDGTLVDVSAFFSEGTVSLGDISMIGETGGDGVARTLDFELVGDIDNNFSPKSKYGVVKYHVQTIIGDGGNTYDLDYENAIESTIRVREVLGIPYQWDEASSWNSGQPATWESPKTADSDYNMTFVLDGTWDEQPSWDEGSKWGTPGKKIVCSQNIPSGHYIRIGYSYIDKTAENPWNWYNGSYEPLIWENRKVFLRAIADEPIYSTQTILCTGSQRYTATKTGIIRDTIRLKSSTDANFYTQVINFDYDTNEFVFDANNIPANGSTVVLMFSYLESKPVTIFEGYISQIQIDRNSVRVFCKDQAKILQQSFVKKGQIRQYTNTYDGTNWNSDDRTTAYPLGVPLLTFLQNCIDDFFGVEDYIIIYADDDVEYNVFPEPEQYEYKTLWDIIQFYSQQAGGTYAGYVYDSSTDSFILKLITPPRTKTTYDYIYTADEDLLMENMDISGENIRNDIQISYRDIDDNKNLKTVNVEDASSIAEYGRRPVLIEEENTSAIDTSTEATTFANAILADSKDLLAGVRIEIPLDVRLQLFDMIAIDNYKMSSDVELVSVQNIQHIISPKTKRFRTQISGFQKVVGAKTKWEKIQTRPSKFRQITLKTSDEVLSLVRDNTLHIKTQAQFESWINTFEFSTTEPTGDTFSYDKVYIYNTGTDYIKTLVHGSTYKSLRGKKSKLDIIGIGNPKMVFVSQCYDTNYNTLFNLYCNDLKVEGCYFQTRILNNSGTDYLTDGKTIIFRVNEYDSTSPDDGKATFSNNTFQFYKQTGTYDTFPIAIVPATNNTTQSFRIIGNTFKDINVCVPSTVISGDTKIEIDSNIIDNSNITSQAFYIIWVYKQLKDLIITRNTVKNMIVYITSDIQLENLSCENIKICQNKFFLDQFRFAYIVLQGTFYNLVLSNVNINDNSIVYKTTTLDFIRFFGRSGGAAGNELKYATIANNVARQDGSGTLSNFLSCDANVTQTSVGELNNQK